MHYYTGVEDRIWCGDGANPPGIFASFLIDINPFRNVPILRDWGISANSQMYVFITTEEQLSVKTQINIIDDLADMRNKVQRFFNLLTNFLSQFGNQLSTAIQNALLDFQSTTTSFIAQLHNAIYGEFKLKYVISVVKDIWKIYTTDIKHATRHIIDDLEFDTSVIANNLTELIESEIARIGRNIDSTVSKIRNSVMSLADRFTGFGFRFVAFVRIFSLEFSVMDIEFVYSIDSLGRCSQFQKVYEIMKGENAIRMLARGTVRTKLGHFLLCERGEYLSIAISSDRDQFIVHIHIEVGILGMTVSGDLLMHNNGMVIRVEGNIWDVFFARIELSTEVGKKWNDLTFNVKGRLGVAVGDNAGTYTASSNFEGSYLNGIRGLARNIADSAINRLQVAQNRLSTAQKSLGNAQKTLTSAQGYLRTCNSKFDNAIGRLEDAKKKIENAKGPFEEALRKLKAAKRNVDNLCTIRTCRPVCIPGIRWKRCGSWIKYSCPQWTSCMIRVPDPFCELKMLVVVLSDSWLMLHWKLPKYLLELLC